MPFLYSKEVIFTGIEDVEVSEGEVVPPPGVVEAPLDAGHHQAEEGLSGTPTTPTRLHEPTHTAGTRMLLMMTTMLPGGHHLGTPTPAIHMSGKRDCPHRGIPMIATLRPDTPLHETHMTDTLPRPPGQLRTPTRDPLLTTTRGIGMWLHTGASASYTTLFCKLL